MIEKLKHVAASAIVLFSILAYGAFLWHFMRPPEWAKELAKEHFVALVCLPVGTVISMFVVLLLHSIIGPIEFRGLGFEFKGASGPVVLWVMCFLALVGAVRITWYLK